MSAYTVPTVLQQHDIPERIRSVSALAGHDYVDLFTMTATGATEYSPEQWARVALEGVSSAAGFIVWQVLCGLRLEKQPSPDYVAGWKVADHGDDWIRLEAASWFMTAHAVVRVDDEHVSVALFVRYDRRAGALIWPPLSIGHRRAMPGLLRHAARRINRSQP